MKREKVIRLFENFYKELNWKHSFNDELQAFISVFSSETGLGEIDVYVLVRDRYIKVYACLNLTVEPEKQKDVAEYLHRANYGLNVGCFEMNYKKGTVRYKSCTYFHGIELNKAAIEDSIIIPLVMIERYGKNLLKLISSGGSPEELIVEAEND